MELAPNPRNSGGS